MTYYDKIVYTIYQLAKILLDQTYLLTKLTTLLTLLNKVAIFKYKLATDHLIIQLHFSEL